MKKFVIVFIVMVLMLVGCSGKDSTKRAVYSEQWNDELIIVEKINIDGNYEVINEVSNPEDVERLIKTLKSINWKENVDVDIRPADYLFTLNGHRHNVWVSDGKDNLSLSIDSRSNYTKVSKKSSKIIFEILIGKEIEQHYQ